MIAGSFTTMIRPRIPSPEITFSRKWRAVQVVRGFAAQGEKEAPGAPAVPPAARAPAAEKQASRGCRSSGFAAPDVSSVLRRVKLEIRTPNRMERGQDVAVNSH